MKSIFNFLEEVEMNFWDIKKENLLFVKKSVPALQSMVYNLKAFDMLECV